MTPKQRYQALIESGQYQVDANQALAIDQLEIIYQAVQTIFATKNKLLKQLKIKRLNPKGLYLWGGVGIGKTWLMDMLYHCLPKACCLRLHFHQFMQQIHLQLEQLKGKKEPFKIIAKQFAKQKIVLCFDEFFVSDIADAMILRGLFEALLAEGIILVTTSNAAPDELYKNGLQREQFLPAIALIKANTKVLHLPTKCDYRVQIATENIAFYTASDEQASSKMQSYFEQVAGTIWDENQPILIAGRKINTIRHATNIVWFSFNALCNIPRSQVDYLEIAQNYRTVLISDVPQIRSDQDNIILYLINLIDIFYDNRIKLIISASVALDDIYPQGRFNFEFQRTKSRLIEMQSQHYFSQAS